MKRILALTVLLAFCMAMVSIFCSCDSNGISVKNADVSYSNDAEVDFRPVCPECGHKGRMKSYRINKGESGSGTEMCEKCFEVFDWEIDRK